ncbi:HAD-IIIA family hydrolase [Salinivibrio sp. ES.052]|uniref:HAD-IIIA family hydrolase n=1 Tax=Salinivibrio sp. ES.052 TaxID=1882823 RepID=UPI00092BB6BF|nr:HAD-IIIA family hydrolase [Salinivibrio sp. ES.052]SIN80444.1 phosphoglycolate phosphatase [Salinivibrio sp. ES.052]
MNIEPPSAVDGDVASNIGIRKPHPAIAPYSLLIFDWDGTVMDSIGRIVSSLDAAARLTGQLPILPPERLQSMIGLSLEKGYQLLYPDADPAWYPNWIAHYRQQFVHDNPTPCQLYPGVKETLVELKAQGFQLAVATGKSRAGLDRAMAETGTHDLFSVTRCADETASKPDPQMLDEVLAQTGIPRDRALMIGDTGHDMQLAINAGMARLAVTWGVEGAASLSTYEPVAVLNSLNELMIERY